MNTNNNNSYTNIDSNNSNNNDNIIPIIDLSIKDKDLLSKQIHNACIYGFFYIIGHNIEQSLLNHVYEYSVKFFSLPSDVKKKFKIKLGDGESNLGYFGSGVSYGTGIDYKEGIYLDLESNGCDCYLSNDDEKKYGIVGFKDTVQKYINKLKIQCCEILELIALGLNLSKDYFYQNHYTSNPHFNLGLLKYQSFNEFENNNDHIKYGIGPHCDWSLITLLYQDNIGGLQIKSNNSNNWLDVKPITGSFVCNVGDMLEIMTNGYYRSKYHQVLYNQSGKDRYSIPFFFNPNKDTNITKINGIPNGIQNYEKDLQLLKFSGSYNDYHLFKMNDLFKNINNN